MYAGGNNSQKSIETTDDCPHLNSTVIIPPAPEGLSVNRGRGFPEMHCNIIHNAMPLSLDHGSSPRTGPGGTLLLLDRTGAMPPPQDRNRGTPPPHRISGYQPSPVMAARVVCLSRSCRRIFLFTNFVTHPEQLI